MSTVLAGRYELGAVLGVGGMARVYAARDRVLDRRVALKVLPQDTVDPVARERFLREARSSAGFAHPNAVAVYDAGEADGSLYLVMELVDGPSLAAHLASDGPLSPAEAAAVADGVLAALGAAHAAGIVHRDVKPGNILLGRDGGVKLADFGIAKRLDDLRTDLTTTGQFIGTPKYLAPEQVAGEPATPATDLYATGVVLYEMLTGEAPFDAGTPMATALAHRDRAVPDLRATHPEVPTGLAGVVARAMAKGPADRFADAAAMRAALHGAVVAPSAPAASGVVPPTRVERTRLLPAGAVSTASGGGWRAPLAIASVAALVAVVALALTRDDDDDDPASTTSAPAPASAATPAPTPVSTTSPPSTAAATTTSPPTSSTTTTTLAPAPTTVAALIVLLAADPSAVGPAGPELLTELERLEDGNARRTRDRAAELLDRIDEWVADGELDPGFAELVRPIVAPLAEGPGNGNEGPGGGEGEDD